MSPSMRFFLVSVALLAAACGNPTVLAPSAYSKACATAADCVPAKLGDQCAPCGCPNTAIAKSEQARYETDRTAAQNGCGPIAAIACGPCQEAVLTCTSGACGLQ